MSSLKHDSHTICSQCRDVNCSVDTRCDECKSWSVEAMQEHLKYQRSLAGKRGSKKSAVTAASVSQPTVASSLVVTSPSVSASVSEDAVLAVLQSLSGSLGFNQTSSTAPSKVPDLAPSVGGATGGVVGMKLHNVESCFESSGVGAPDNSVKSTSPVMLSETYNVLQSSARHYVGLGTVSAAEFAAPVGHSPSPLGSSGADQLRVPGLGPLPPSSSSSSLSPTSLLFPLTPSPSFLPRLPPLLLFLLLLLLGFLFPLLRLFLLFLLLLPPMLLLSILLFLFLLLLPSLLPPCPRFLFLLPLWLHLLFLLPFCLFSLPLPLPSFPLPLLLPLILSILLPLRLSHLLLASLLPLSRIRRTCLFI